MSIDFVIANNWDNAICSNDSVEFAEYIYNFLWKNYKNLSQEIKLLIELDPYDDKEFQINEIKQLIEECKLFNTKDKLRQFEKIVCEDEIMGIINFSNNLISLSKYAIENNKRIFSLGD